MMVLNGLRTGLAGATGVPQSHGALTVSRADGSQGPRAQSRGYSASLLSRKHLFPEFPVLRFLLGMRRNTLSEGLGCSVTVY